MTDLAQVYLEQATDAEGREHWSGPPEMVDRIAALVGTEERDVVLDVGCGLGGPARRLAAVTGCEVVGLDVVEPVLRLARERAAESTGTVRFVLGSADAVPLAAEAVDQVWSLGAVAHFSDRRKFAAEAVRVLRPGGKLAVTELFWDGRRKPAFAATAPQPWHAVTARGLARELRLAGFAGVRVLRWPGEGIPGALDVGDPALAADLDAGRLVPRIVLARKPERDAVARHETGPR